jgi:dTDP-4-dehydrorhamnose reductase
MKIVIIGAGGRLGAALMREYGGKFNVTGFNHAQLDLADPKKIHAKIDNLDFDILINAAAFTNVDLCEKERAQAFRINAEAPQALAEICRDKNAKLIHISTDYVFDGEQREPYTETDPANPISVYGESKRAGEENVLSVQDRHLVVRVSWIFGPDRPSFIDAVIKQARENEHVDAIADKFATPTYTLDIAQMLPQCFNVDPVAAAAGRGKAGPNGPSYSGVLHFANGGECSWQEYAQHALDCCHKFGVPLKAKTVAPLKLADMKNFIARRPVYSVLSIAKFSSLTGISPRSWREAVAGYVQDHVCN